MVDDFAVVEDGKEARSKDRQMGEEQEKRDLSLGEQDKKDGRAWLDLREMEDRKFGRLELSAVLLMVGKQ